MKTKRALPPARAGGYTIIELLTVVTIVGVLASIGLPSLGWLAHDLRRSVAVNDLLLAFAGARSEAAKRGQDLVVCAVRDHDGDGSLSPAEQHCAGRDWSWGWMIALWNDADGDGIAATRELVPLRIMQSPSVGAVTVEAGNFANSPSLRPAGSVLIKAFGRRASNGTITFCDKRGSAAARAVIVASTGRSRVSGLRADGMPLRCP